MRNERFKPVPGTYMPPFIYLKAAVEPAQLWHVLPAYWHIEAPRYFVCHPTAMAGPVPPPAGYTATAEREHSAFVLRFADETGQTAAIGRVVLNRGTAVFDRIETREPHRRRGPGAALMCIRDALAQQARVCERQLAATQTGCALYTSLGWQVVAPYSTAALPASWDCAFG